YARTRVDTYPQWGHDKSGAINAAAQDIRSGSGSAGLIFPCGSITLNSPVDLTNIQGMEFDGCVGDNSFNGAPGSGYPFARYNTVFIGNTGGIVFDLTGSSSVMLRNFNVVSNTKLPNPSTIAFLFGRDNAGGGGANNRFCFSQFVTMDRVFASLDHIPAANGNQGTFGIYNVNAEHFTVLKSFFQADVPELFLGSNAMRVASPYQALQTGCPSSMSIVKQQDVGIRGSSTKGAFVELQGVDNFHFDNFYVQSGVAATAGAFSITGRSPSENIWITAQVEHLNPTSETGFAMLFVGNNIDNLQMAISTAATGACSGGCPAWVGFDTAGRTIKNSSLRVNQVNGTHLQLIQNLGDTVKNSWIYPEDAIDADALILSETHVVAPSLTDRNLSFAPTSSAYIDDQDGISQLHDGIFNPVATTYRLATAYTNSTTSLTNVAGVSIPVAADKTYHVTCQLYYKAAPTGGLQVAFTTPASPAGFHAGAVIQTNTSNAQTTGVTTSRATKIPVTGVAVGTAATDFMATVEATLRNGANAGTMQLQAASVAAAQLTIETDSECMVH
ncbi:MAG TPA: hypothetical protein VHQ22_09380, partial [Terriglobales bacterium]|nr:hypothetical protein [Terriglobales bacterium]